MMIGGIGMSPNPGDVEKRLAHLGNGIDALAAQVQAMAALLASMPLTADINQNVLKNNLLIACQKFSPSLSSHAQQFADAILAQARQHHGSGEIK